MSAVIAKAVVCRAQACWKRQRHLLRAVTRVALAVLLALAPQADSIQAGEYIVGSSTTGSVAGFTGTIATTDALSGTGTLIFNGYGFGSQINDVYWGVNGAAIGFDENVPSVTGGSGAVLGNITGSFVTAPFTIGGGDVIGTINTNSNGRWGTGDDELMAPGGTGTTSIWTGRTNTVVYNGSTYTATARNTQLTTVSSLGFQTAFANIGGTTGLSTFINVTANAGTSQATWAATIANTAGTQVPYSAPTTGGLAIYGNVNQGPAAAPRNVAHIEGLTFLGVRTTLTESALGTQTFRAGVGSQTVSNWLTVSNTGLSTGQIPSGTISLAGAGVGNGQFNNSGSTSFTTLVGGTPQAKAMQFNAGSLASPLARGTYTSGAITSAGTANTTVGTGGYINTLNGTDSTSSASLSALVVSPVYSASVNNPPATVGSATATSTTLNMKALVNYNHTPSTFTVTNTSTDNVALASLTLLSSTNITGAGFKINGGTTLGANQSIASNAGGTAFQSNTVAIDTTGGVLSVRTNTATGTLNVNTDVNAASGVGGSGQTYTYAITATGVAPVQQVPTTTFNFGNIRVGTSATNQAATVNNIGDGNQSGLGAISNLQGSLGSVSNPVFTGAGGSVNLADSFTTSYFYGFTPTARTAYSGTSTAVFTNGNSAGTNAGENVTLNFSGTGVSPVYVASVNNPPATISSGTNPSATMSMNALVNYNNTPSTFKVTNTSTDNVALASLTLLSSTNISGAGFTLNGGTTLGANQTITSNAGGTNFQNNTVALNTAAAGLLVRGNTTTGTLNVDTDVNAAAGVGGSGQAYSYAITATGVAPVQQVPTTSYNFGTARIGTTTASQSVTVNNIGDGNLSGLGSLSNLQGSVSTASNAAYGGAGGSVNLADSGSSAYSYNFAPTTHGSIPASVTAAFTNGNAAGTNTAQNVSINFSGVGVGPDYQSVQAPGSTIIFPDTYAGFSSFQTIQITNATTDIGSLSLVGLTLSGASITGDPQFSVVGFAPTVLGPGGIYTLTLEFDANLPLTLRNGVLTIQTDQNAAFGGIGSTFVYNLQAQVVPEPGTIVIWSVLALAFGVVGYRRRRGTKAA